MTIQQNVFNVLLKKKFFNLFNILLKMFQWYGLSIGIDNMRNISKPSSSKQFQYFKRNHLRVVVPRMETLGKYNWGNVFRTPGCRGWDISAVQKIQKLSESPTTTAMAAKSCGINCENRKITNKNYSTSYANVKINEKVPNLRIKQKEIP